MDNPWRALLPKPPFVLDVDRASVKQFNLKAKPKVQIHLEALPEPFIGNPDTPVVLLNLNPGFGEKTLYFHQRNDYFRASYWRNLNHMPADYPFYLLDPQNAASPGYQWWFKRLRQLIEVCGQRQVAANVLCVEYFPYASKSFGFKGLLPSQQYSFNLVQLAIKRGAVVVVMRSENRWINVIPALKHYGQLFRLHSVQSPYITENNCPNGYSRIVKAILL